MHYEIIEADTAVELRDKVNRSITLGGKPLGGVTVVQFSYGTKFYQAFLFN